MLKIPKAKEWEENAFRFIANSQMICAVLTTYDNYHDISYRVNAGPQTGQEAAFVAKQFLDRVDLYHVRRHDVVSSARVIRYYPGMVGN